MENVFFLRIFTQKKLDNFLIEVIKEKNLELLDQLYPPDYNKIKDCDFHRIISHYVYENSKNHQFKMTNYVALYGFLRALSLICCFLSWLFVSKAIKEIWIYYKNIIQIETFSLTFSDFNTDLFCTIILSLLATYVYFMGFMKFYRRYSFGMCQITGVKVKL